MFQSKEIVRNLWKQLPYFRVKMPPFNIKCGLSSRGGGWLYNGCKKWTLL